MIDEGILKSRAKLPFGYTVTFTWSPDRGLGAEWEPDVPEIAKPRAQRRFDAAYVAARNAFVEEIATVLGGPICVTGVGDLDTIDTIEPRLKH